MPQKPPKNGDKEANKEVEGDELDNLKMTVPQLSGNAKAIQHLKSSKAVENL